MDRRDPWLERFKAACRGGREASFEIFKELNRMARGIVYKIGRAWNMQDIVQQAFFNLFHNYGRGDNFIPGNFHSAMWLTVRNTFIDMLREENPLTPLNEELIQNIAGKEEAPLEQIVSAEQGEQILSAIKGCLELLKVQYPKGWSVLGSWIQSLKIQYGIQTGYDNVDNGIVFDDSTKGTQEIAQHLSSINGGTPQKYKPSTIRSYKYRARHKYLKPCLRSKLGKKGINLDLFT